MENIDERISKAMEKISGLGNVISESTKSYVWKVLLDAQRALRERKGGETA